MRPFVGAEARFYVEGVFRAGYVMGYDPYNHPQSPWQCRVSGFPRYDPIPVWISDTEFKDIRYPHGWHSEFYGNHR